jgi:amyloid beta precursor protein binding protein 1
MASEGATTPPVLHRPSAKEKKYDRQLRLWAASGQAALENAHLLLVNAGSGVVGIETLKNLVLPGELVSFASDHYGASYMPK